MIKIGVYGAAGKMGKEIISALSRNDKCILEYAFTRDAGNIDELCIKSDVVIDVSSPEGALALLPYAEKHNVKLLTCTTGFTKAQYQKLIDSSEKIALLHAVNTNFLVNILEYLVSKSAKILGPEYEVEILESHHAAKKDTPSGTALNLGRLVSEARNHDFIPHDHQNGMRPDNAIGFSVIRGGTLPGEHQVMFIGQNDKITLSQTAQNRIGYAEGAIKAAIWLASQPQGLYKMQDIFNFD